MEPTLIIDYMWFKNFGPYLGEHEFAWDRRPGVYYIQAENLQNPGKGSNGCGKTMIFTALFWGLTGRTLRNIRPGDRIEPWLGAEGEETYVDVKFIRAGVEHVVKRSRNPNKLMLDGKVVTEEDVQRAIGIRPEVMLVTFLIGQTNDLFLDMKPEPQSQFFTDLLNLDQWLDAADKAGKRLSELNAITSDTRRAIERQDGRKIEIEEQLVAGRAASVKFAKQAKERLETAEYLLEKIIKQEQGAKADLDALPAPTDLTTETEARDAAARKVNSLTSSLRELKRDLSDSVETLAEKTKALNTVVDAGKCPECGQVLPATDRSRKTRQLKTAVSDLAERKITFGNDLALVESDLAVWEKKLTNGQATLDESRRKTASLEPKRTSLTQALQRIRDNRVSTEQHVQNAKTVKNPYIEQIAEGETRLKDTIAKLEELREQFEADEYETGEAKFWQNAYREIRLGIIEDTLAEVSMTSTKHVERLGLTDWAIEFTTEKETKSGKVSHSFTALLYPPNMDEAKPWDIYSGGESTRWKLAVSFGLGEVLLSKIGFLPNVEILDEATKGLSAEGITDLLECLTERARENQRAIYVIDHHVIEKGSFTGVITVQKRASGSSIVEV